MNYKTLKKSPQKRRSLFPFLKFFSFYLFFSFSSGFLTETCQTLWWTNLVNSGDEVVFIKSIQDMFWQNILLFPITTYIFFSVPEPFLSNYLACWAYSELLAHIQYFSKRTKGLRLPRACAGVIHSDNPQWLANGKYP